MLANASPLYLAVTPSLHSLASPSPSRQRGCLNPAREKRPSGSTRSNRRSAKAGLVAIVTACARTAVRLLFRRSGQLVEAITFAGMEHAEHAMALVSHRMRCAFDAIA